MAKNFKGNRGKKLKKILFFAPRFHTNQIGTVHALNKLGYIIKYVILNHKHFNSINPIDIETKFIDYSIVTNFFFGVLNLQKKDNFFRKYSFAKIRDTYQYIKLEKPNLIVVRDHTIQSSIVYVISKFLKIPCVLYWQYPLSLTPKKYYSKFSIYTTLFPKIKYTPLTGKSGKKILLDRIFHVPFLVQINDVIKKDTNDIKIISVGKFGLKRKNQELLINVFSRLILLYPNLKLSLCGTGDKSSSRYLFLKEYVKELNLSQSINFYLNLTYKQMQDKFAESNLFILPSSNEPASISILEAMSHKCAIISSDSNGTNDYIIEGKSGLIFKSGSEESLFRTTEIMLKNGLSNYAEMSYKLIKLMYNEENFINSFNKMLTLIK